jgi:predicted small lipoprotein YifL
MSPSRSSVRVLSLALIALPLLAGCGNKGALVKPPTTPEATPKMVPVIPVQTTPLPTSDSDGH